MTASNRLACPHCGAITLYSSEKTTIDYPITAELDKAGFLFDYTGDSSYTNDEGTSYEGAIYCRACGSDLTEGQLITIAVYAHLDPSIVHVEEDSDRGADTRFQAVCWAMFEGYGCDWASRWVHTDEFGDADDPAQRAYLLAERFGQEHLRQFGVDDDGITAPPSEDVEHGHATDDGAPQGAPGAVPSGS